MKLRKSDVSEVSRQTVKTVSDKRCFNCGDKGHVSRECPSKDYGPKCFACNEFGHLASDSKNTVANTVLICSKGDNLYPKQRKEVTIGDMKFIADMDTCADLSLISKYCYEEIGSPPLQDKTIFKGIGSVNNTEGSFQTKVTVDNEILDITLHVVDEHF